MSRLLISAAHKSSGKTTITAGICAAISQRQLEVQAFKKGPDYIDPMWLGMATNRNCHNLDFHNMHSTEIQSVFQQNSLNADISIIEGNKGLFDGVDLEGGNSNAELAKQLRAPVVLVIDCKGMTRGIAPLLLGYQAFDENIEIAGVILNKLGGARHERKLREIVAHYTDFPVLGAVQYDAEMEISERHLGLIPSNESIIAEKKLAYITKQINKQVNIDKLIAIGQQAVKLPSTQFLHQPIHKKNRVRIGIAFDKAFGFYYPGDLQALESAGAELVHIDTLNDKILPDIDGLFIGGGFPETQAESLQANKSLKTQIKHAIENGLPSYAECGGLMYLSRSLLWHGKHYEMVGVIPGDTIMHDKPQGRGYMKLKETSNALWPAMSHSQNKSLLNVHEFHYSSLENLDPSLEYAYEVKRGHGITGQHDGIIIHNLLANYAHMRHVEQNRWASRFINFVNQCKKKDRLLPKKALG